MTATIYGAADRAYQLAPTSVKTTTYTAIANQLIPVNTTGGAVTVNAPTMPPDGTMIGVKLVAGSNAITLQAGGSDVFNIAGGPSSLTLTVLDQGVLAQYSASAGVWYVQSDDLPLAQLDQRYAGANAVSVVFNAKNFGATGGGVTDDTSAINSTISAARTFAPNGAEIYLPPGVYLVTPGVSTAAITLNNGTTGYAGIRIVGDGPKTTQLKKTGNGVMIAMSGAVSDLTGATHCTYCSLENITLNGNGFTGMMVQTYYADDLLFLNARFMNNADVCIATAEFWDSRFINCVWDTNGSTTANTVAPNVWLTNTQAPSGYGASTDVVNQIYFWGCRWEGFRSGAVRIERGPGGGTGQPAAVYFTDCKMETIFLNGGSSSGPTGSHLYVDTTCQFVAVDHLYCYSGGFFSGYSTANDVIYFSPQNGVLSAVTIRNESASATVANGITVNSPLANGTVTLRDVRGKYTTTAPTGAHCNFGGTNTGTFVVHNVTSDNGTQFGGTIPGSFTACSPLTIVAGSVSDGSFPTTPLQGTVALDSLHNRIYGKTSSSTWYAVPLDTVAAAITSTTTIASSNTLTSLQSAAIPANDPQSGSTYVLEGSGTYGVTGTPTLTFAAYWGTTGGTLLTSLPAITAASSITGAPFKYRVFLDFRSTTSVVVTLEVELVTTTATGAITKYVNVSGPTTVTTTGANTLTIGFTWSVNSASNTISLLSGQASKRH